MNTKEDNLKPFKGSPLSLVELQDKNGEWHDFHLLHNKRKISYGGVCNCGFLESGHMIIDPDFSLDENLQAMIENLQVLIDEGVEYTELETEHCPLVQ